MNAHNLVALKYIKVYKPTIFNDILWVIVTPNARPLHRHIRIDQYYVIRYGRISSKNQLVKFLNNS